MNQNLSLYNIFNCVAEKENISHAARALYISQPAVSKAISSLEDNLNVTLFIRSSRGVKLTPEGRLLYDHTKSAFQTIDKAEDSLKRINDLGIGHLKIGASNTLCKFLLLPYLKDFVKQYPHIKITIESQSTYQTLKRLENGSLDIGLVAKPDNEKTFVFNSLGSIEDIFVATPDYLENLKQREESEDFFSVANIMLLDEENNTRIYIEEYFRDNDISPNSILEVTNMDLLIEFAKTGLGVACVIKEFVETELSDGTLVQLPLKVPVNKREVGYSYISNAFLSDSMQKFIAFTR
ncbi:MAG TPA: LysR family transcriptional regulator [Clostridiales bacterium]|nr:LysR family transcriptional regulator [Clostridiales bacterium]